MLSCKEGEGSATCVMYQGEKGGEVIGREDLSIGRIDMGLQL